MKLSRILPALLVASMVVVAASCGDDDDAAIVNGDGSSSDADGGTGDGPDGMPALFALSACDTLQAEDLDAAGFEPEPSDTLGEAGSSTGNACWWKGGLGSSRAAMVGFTLSDLESNYFEEVTTDDETEVAGWPARRLTGTDDMIGSGPACGVRVEVEPGVILEVGVAVGQTTDYSTDDQRRLDQACAILDTLVPIVSAQVPGVQVSGGEGDSGSADEDGTGGATVPADAAITNDLLCGALAVSEIPAPGFESSQPAPLDSSAEGMCEWDALGGDQPQVRLTYSADGTLSPDDPALETDGRPGSIVQADDSSCSAKFARAPGTVDITVVRVDDVCGVAEELAQLLAPRFPQAG